MNKMTFEVGKMYLTRDGHQILIETYVGNMIIGATHREDGTEWFPMWYAAGNYFFSGQSPMDLMPLGITEFGTVTELELEGKAVRERGIESALIKLGWTPPSKKDKDKTDALSDIVPMEMKQQTGERMDLVHEMIKDGMNVSFIANATLFKANLNLLAELDTLQKEKVRLHVALQESRMIAQGMVDAAKCKIF